MNTIKFIKKLIQYNLKIIFANKFIWFFLASLVFFLFFMVNSVWQGSRVNAELVYNILLFPGVLLIFYPTVFGIQHDEDARILEILFGIPNYRYKVWLVRLIMIFLQTFVILLIFCFIAQYLLCPIDVVMMTLQVMFPIVFIGSLAFLLSTRIRNGNGTAVVMVILGIILMIMAEALDRSMFNVFLNPYDMPTYFNETVWQTIIVKNRVFLPVASVVWVLWGLINLQKREKFV